MNKQVLLATVICLASQGAVAATNPGNYYGGANVTKHTVKAPEESSSFNVLSGALGYQLNSHVALEARLGVGITDEKSGDETVSISHAAQLLVKGQFSVSDSVVLYGLAGYADTKYSSEDHIIVDLAASPGASCASMSAAGSCAGGRSSSAVSESGFTYGVGAELSTTGPWSVYAEWQKLPSIDVWNGSVGVSALTLGVNYRF